MKDYYKKMDFFRQTGLGIPTDEEKKNMVLRFDINHEDNTIGILYANGLYVNATLNDEKIAELENMQKDTLDQMCSDIALIAGNPLYDSSFWLTGLFGMGAINELARYDVNAGCLWLTSAAVMGASAYVPYKLNKEVQLVKWIVDNSDKVNEVIKEEVDAYPKSIGEEGINLNNIELLKPRELRKLKRKCDQRG